MAKYRVTLTDEERVLVQKMVSSGKGAARKLRHAHILLQADASPGGLNRTDEEIAKALTVGISTIHRVRQRFVEESFEAALHPRPQPARPSKVKIKGETEKQLIALACSDPLTGHCRWTVHLLADKIVELGYIEGGVSDETVRQSLKKTTSNSRK